MNGNTLDIISPSAFMAPSLELLTFNGTDNEDVTLFVRDVKRVAMAQGRQRDQEWMVDYVESCLGGQAMRWFSQLDVDSDDQAPLSWRALRQGLLNRFGAPPPPPPSIISKFGTTTVGSSSPIKSEVSQSPSMSLVIGSSSPTPINLGVDLHARRGRVKLTSSQGHVTGYVCRKWSKRWLYDDYAPTWVIKYTEDASDALIFELPITVSPSRLNAAESLHLRIVDTSEASLEPIPTFLGVVKGTAEHFPCNLDFCIEKDSRRSRVESVWPPDRFNPASKDVWTLEASGKLLLTWADKNNAADTCGLEVHTGDRAFDLFLSRNSMPEWSNDVASLSFEPA
ncbi:hypothetical protein FRB93_007477 [Tulasnella sp. JGI-2019a]|nr:hypothetical protein FRB93_007477 [Tulasnella sp. JGI-2019a]